MKPNLGLSGKSREAIVGRLAAILADQHVLYIKTRNFHWNVVGPRFNDLHKFFEEQYGELAEAVDEVAERIRALGGTAPGSMKEFLKLARLEEAPGGHPASTKMIAALLADHEAVIRQLREDVVAIDDELGDAGTADFLTGLMEDHEKKAWMLRSFLQE